MADAGIARGYRGRRRALRRGVGAFPSRDILATILLAAASAADHLVATGSVLRGRNAVFAPYTVMRAAAEAAAMAVYLTDPAIDGRERVRRNMNCRLDALCER